MATIFVDDTRVLAALNGAKHVIQNLEPVMKEIQAVMVADIKDHFEREQGPSGGWAQLSEYTIQKRRKAGRFGTAILRDTYAMFNSLKGGAMSRNRISKSEAVVGTALDYAVKQQFGEGRIPARPFLYLSEEAKKRAVDMIILAINREIVRMSGRAGFGKIR